MSDAALTECQKCGGVLRRVIFPPAVVYKGSGFYVTDYKNGGRSSEGSTGASKSETGSASTETKSETPAKTETKSEAKTESKPDAKTTA